MQMLLSMKALFRTFGKKENVRLDETLVDIDIARPGACSTTALSQALQLGI